MRARITAALGVVLLCAACTSTSGGHPKGDASSGAHTQVVCASSGPPGADLTADRDILKRRASALAGAPADVQIKGDTIVVVLPGARDYAVTNLCGPGLLNFRAVVMPGMPVTHPQTSPSANPLAGFSFPIPSTDTEFNKLATTQQQQLQNAVGNFDCKAGQQEPDIANKPFLACDDGKGYGSQLAYLLGPVIVPGNEIKTASAQALNQTEGQPQWTVSLALKPAVRISWARYTAAHNAGGATATSGPVTECGISSTPCADYVAFTLDGNVISAPVNQAAIYGGVTRITGNFSSQDAHRLANELTFGNLPTGLRLASVRRIK